MPSNSKAKGIEKLTDSGIPGGGEHSIEPIIEDVAQLVGIEYLKGPFRI